MRRVTPTHGCQSVFTDREDTHIDTDIQKQGLFIYVCGHLCTCFYIMYAHITAAVKCTQAGAHLSSCHGVPLGCKTHKHVLIPARQIGTAALPCAPRVSARRTTCNLLWLSLFTKTMWLGVRKDWPSVSG